MGTHDPGRSHGHHEPAGPSRGRDRIRSKQQVIGMLRRAGFPDETIRAVDAEFGDTIDFDRDGDALVRHGITHSLLTDQLGGGP